MQYLLEKAGFSRVEIVYTPNSRPPINIPELKINSDGSTEEFNKAMKQVSQMLFGSQDYSAIAYK